MPRGSFYLGEVVGDDGRTGEPVLYDSDHLTTHGVIVGMTGSGKTGLGVGLLEEALLSGIPTIVLDPKGDMGNLALTFPDLAPANFQPWISEDAAESNGRTVAEQAAATADLWRNGLADWGVEPSRIRELREAPVTIYTPGSSAGCPMNVIGSLAAPDDVSDMEDVRDEIEGFVTSILTLVGITADPLSSREHILLSNLIEHSWSEGRDLDLATLVGQVMNPPMRKLGVFEIDQFFPSDDRMKLAMRLNGVIASPSFAAWTEGPAIDIDAMTRTSDGRPRCAVITLAHLSDDERQFVVTLILSKLITWMRAQSGSSDLRMLMYMDEVFGFLPPTAAPPSKKPLLTLLKQARAFGVGVVLSTQNPVDLDYKALSNTGTWMIGRLQTERDKQRLMDGLTAASGGVDVGALTDTISGLPKRTFVLHETRGKGPKVFNTRWVMSYLAGPMSRDQIERVAATQDTPELPTTPTVAAAPNATSSAPAAATPAEPAGPTLADDETDVMPEVADGTKVAFVDPGAPWARDAGADVRSTRFEPALVARVNLLFDDEKAGLRQTEEFESILHPLTDFPDPEAALVVDYDDRDLQRSGPDDAVFAITDARIDTKTYFNKYKTALRDHLWRNLTVDLLANKELKAYGRPGETAEQFARRCRDIADDEADKAAASLRDKYDAKLDRAELALAKAEDRHRELEADVSNRKKDELLSGAGSLLSVFLGGRKKSRSLAGKLGGIGRRRSQSNRAGERLRSAENRVSDAVEKIRALEDELADDLAEITDEWETKAEAITVLEVGLEKTDVQVDEVVLAWLPVSR